MAIDEHSIAVIIPTYERAHLVERALESVLGQSHAPDEVIVVDDGSTDDTAKRVRTFDAVRHLYQRNSGVAAARNLGVRCATSRWVAFLDSDDHWLDGHLERLHRAIVATSGRGLLYFADIQQAESGGLQRHWDRSNFSTAASVEFNHSPADWAFLPRQPMMMQASIIERASYLRLGGLDPRLRTREDTHFFFRLALEGPACAVAGVGAEITDDGDPVTRLFGAGHGPGTKPFETGSVTMYADLLAHRPASLQPVHCRTIRRRLKAAHFCLARLCRDDGDWVGAARHLIGGIAASPRHTAISGLARIGLADKADA